MSETFQIAGGQSTVLSSSITGPELFLEQSQAGLSDANTIAYDASTDSFVLKITEGRVPLDVTFAPSDIDPTFPSSKAVAYRSSNTSLYLLKPGADGIGLSYVTYGQWIRPTDWTQGYLIFGVRTAGAAMPTTGTASFTGSVSGVSAEENRKFGLGGTVELTADFAAGTLTGDFKDMTRTDPGGTSLWHDATVNASISGNTFAGTVRAKDIELEGPTNGGFFGPGAPEIGGSWAMENADIHAVGVFVGKRP